MSQDDAEFRVLRDAVRIRPIDGASENEVDIPVLDGSHGAWGHHTPASAEWAPEACGREQPNGEVAAGLDEHLCHIVELRHGFRGSGWNER